MDSGKKSALAVVDGDRVLIRADCRPLVRGLELALVPHHGFAPFLCCVLATRAGYLLGSNWMLNDAENGRVTYSAALLREFGR